MGGEWREVQLEDIATEITVGHVGPMATEYIDAGIPFLRSLNVEPLRLNTNDIKYISPAFHRRLKKSALAPGDVVIVRTGKPGACCVVPSSMPEANCSDLVIVRCGPDLDPDFLSYYINSKARAHVDAHLVGAVQQHFNVGSARQMQIRLPSLEEQRRISKVLGALNDKIDLNGRMSETLEAIARALFKSWFVDFDPVRAKAEGRETGLPAEIAELFPDGFDDSELGEVPSGWRVGRFGDLVELLRDQENPLAAPDEIFQHYSLPAFDEGRYPTSELGAGIKSQKCRVPAGAVLLSKLNPEIERVWIVDVQPADRAVCSTEFLVLRARHAFTRAFVYCLARSRPFRRLIEGLVTGTSKSHQRAQAQAILDIPVVIPPVPLVGHFDKVAEVLLVRVLTCRSESRTLATLRDALLPKLISGELPVGKVNAALGATS